MHSIETIIANNQKAGAIIASQADRAKRVEDAAWRVINSKLLDEQQKAIYELKAALETKVTPPGPRPLGEILSPGE